MLEKRLQHLDIFSYLKQEFSFPIPIGYSVRIYIYIYKEVLFIRLTFYILIKPTSLIEIQEILPIIFFK